ncbi:ankyrin repeat domain-containing protein [Lacinutrix jangbogonensis]|uniref:ankyrin repeat domain-containing protein n=1 Tax=Lacinutrix jangbogonensis TaxID=1469557 RepID=UPI00053D9ED1|nr:ankyrin repeat domain-containing protein [Lacinutrix jangbogonensis]
MKLKGLFILSLTLFLSLESSAQNNVFLSRDYWKAHPSVSKVENDVKAGNDASELNANAFDAVVYALLEKADNKTIEFLLSQKGNSVNKKTHDSRTYIFWAAYKGNTKIMEHLFNKGAVINITDSHGNTPVTFAAATGQKNTAVYDLFEKNGAVLSEEKNEDGVNALLLIAPYLDNEKELDYFIGKGFNLKTKDPKGNNIFNYAAKNGNIEFLKLLIEKDVDSKITNKEGGNAILYASQGTRNSKNTLETYKFLENLGVKVNIVGDRGRNPLHAIAYSSDNLDLFSYFIEKGVAINIKDNGGDSPFMNAANSNNLKVVEFLSKYITDFNVKDKNGRSALAMAVNRNTLDVVGFLLKKGADIKTIDKEGNSLAYYLLNTFKAEKPKEFETKLKLLQDNGLVLNQIQNNGNTLLHIATQRNNLVLIKRLKPFGIAINTKNKEGYTALQIAAMKAQDALILKYLLTLGADKTIKTEFDETVFDLANENELLNKENKNLNFLK